MSPRGRSTSVERGTGSLNELIVWSGLTGEFGEVDEARVAFLGQNGRPLGMLVRTVDRP